MATYKFKNLDTDEIFEQIMSVHDIDEYKKNNPNFKQLLTGFACVTNTGIKNNVPHGFRDLLNNIHKNTPESTIGSHN